MEVNTVMTLKSLEARKSDPRNEPGHFTVKFIPQITLDENYCPGSFEHVYARWYTLRSENGNDKLVISKDSGKT